MLHHTSSETYFVNCKLHSTLYSTLLIYSVKAYFKRNPRCVYLSKFIGFQPVLMAFTLKMRGASCGQRRMASVTKVIGFFIFSYLEDNCYCLRSFDPFCVRGVHIKS